MDLWHWLNRNSGALESIAAFVAAFLSFVTICVLWVTWGAIKRQALASEAQARASEAQAKAADALKAVADEQMELTIRQTTALNKQAEAALQAASATEAANRIAEESNRLTAEQMLADLRPIPVYTQSFSASVQATQEAIRNVGRGPAIDVQIALGAAKDELPGQYLPSRSLIGIKDEIPIALNPKFLESAAITIRYDSLDGRRFTTTFYRRGDSIKHDFAEYRKIDGLFRAINHNPA